MASLVLDLTTGQNNKAAAGDNNFFFCCNGPVTFKLVLLRKILELFRFDWWRGWEPVYENQTHSTDLLNAEALRVVKVGQTIFGSKKMR